MCLGCGTEPDFTTAYGVEVSLNGHARIKREHANVAELFLVNELSRLLDAPSVAVAACLSAAEVRVTGPELSCPADFPECTGNQEGAAIQIMEVGCLYDTTYLHELSHWVLECLEGDSDQKHRSETVWRAIEAFPVRCP
jgi:hypothetical protein